MGTLNLTRGVRAEWLYRTVRECQALVGDAFKIATDDLDPRTGTFLESLPAPENGVENLLQRGLLLETALQCGVTAHHSFHRFIEDRIPDRRACPFVPATTVEEWPQDLSRSAHHAFRRWSQRFAAAFANAHPLLPACRAESFIERHYAQSIRPADLARLLGCPVASLQRAFATLTGMSLREFHTRVRVHNAVRLLETTDLKIDAIAREVGYESKKDLYRLIRARVGGTPLQVRHRRRAC